MSDDAGSSDNCGRSTDLPIGGGLIAALALLKRAFDCARDARAPPWDFALEIEELYAVGLTITDLRWMVAKGLVEHASETSHYGDEHRSFTPSRGLSFLPTTCVILTAKGATVAARANVAPSDDSSGARGKLHSRPSLKPHWDAARRVLSLGGRTVKKFLVPARNQELILSSFQQDGWPASIDDPLADEFDTDPKIRLNDVVYRLNHKQIASLIRFHVNGQGRSVQWSLRAPQTMRSNADSADEARASV